MTVAELEAAPVLRELLDGCPVPAGWHPGWEAIAQVFADFRRAVETLEGADPEPPLDVEAARARLASLPRPEGQHPYLDAIMPALEAMELALDLLEEA